MSMACDKYGTGQTGMRHGITVLQCLARYVFGSEATWKKGYFWIVYKALDKRQDCRTCQAPVRTSWRALGADSC